MFTSTAPKVLLVVAAALTVGVGITTASASTDPPPPTDPPPSTGTPPAEGTAVVESDGFASAEDAASAYLYAFSAGDLAGAMAALSIEVYVENFDFEAMIEWQSFYLPAGNAVPLPSGDPLNTAINAEQRRAVVVDQILDQYFTLLDPELERTRGEQVDDAAEFTSSLTATMTSESLAGLAEFEFVPLDDVDADAAELYAGRDVENRANRDAVLGADETLAIAATTTVEGRPVTLLFEAVRYGDAWWLDSLGGRFATIVGLDYQNAGVITETADEAGDAVDATDPVDGSDSL